MKAPYGLPCVESCLTCKLRSEEFFCNLTQESLEAFNRIKHAAVFPEGSVIFVEGQVPRGVFILCQGQAKLSICSRDGKTMILRIAKPGEVLGLHAVVKGTPYEVTAQTMQPCQTDFVNQSDFLGFLKEHGDACLQAAKHISRDCRDAYDVVRSIGLSNSVSSRVATFLLASGGDGQTTKRLLRTRLVLTHEDIAQIIGTSRESITRTLSEFRKIGVAELKGSWLIIHNQSALMRLAAA